MRTEKEIRPMIEVIEEIYPPNKNTNLRNPIANYFLGILAGLKCALGEYEIFSEMDMEDFMKATFEVMK